MQTLKIRDMTVFAPDWLSDHPHLVCIFTTRPVPHRPPRPRESSPDPSDASPGAHDRKAALAALGIDPSSTASSRQVHSNRVLHVRQPGRYDGFDALLTDRAGLLLHISVADCLAILLADPVRGLVAVAHAGWRGTRDGIAVRTVMQMRNLGSQPEHVLAFLSPRIGPCCYEVGPEFRHMFPAFCTADGPSGTRFDLSGANASQLLSSGLRRRNIEISSLCTACRPELFHSWRREGKAAGRMLAVAGTGDELKRRIIT